MLLEEKAICKVRSAEKFKSDKNGKPSIELKNKKLFTIGLWWSSFSEIELYSYWFARVNRKIEKLLKNKNWDF